MGKLIRIVRMDTRKQVGLTTYLICCPFHLEKTPSCKIDEMKMTYVCMSCGMSGKVDWKIKPRRK